MVRTSPEYKLVTKLINHLKHNKNMKKVFKLKKVTSFPLKFDLKMKLTTLLLIVSLFQLQATESYAQKTKVTLNLEKVSLENVLNKIESLTEFKFFFNYNEFNYEKIVSVNAKKERISSILKRLFKGSNISFQVIDKQIVLNSKKVVKEDKEEETTIFKQQGFIVNGTIVDNNGQPLPGANVLEKGTTNGAQTDFDGNFSLTVADENSVLIVSYIGFSTQEVNVNNQSTLTISLKEDAAKLDEIVIVGYGTQNERRVTTSISSINLDETEKAGLISADAIIQGKVSGVQIAATSGNPGGQQRINIRGIGSLQGDNLPLIVIDGIPISNSDPSSSLNGVFGSVNNQSPLALLNPNDIERMDILKDASATAIYGSRGTNGVIIITTKKGKAGKSKVSVSSYRGIQFAPEKIETANVALWLEVNNEARSNLNADNGLTTGDPGFLAPLTDALPAGQTEEYDWTGGITNSSSLIQDHNISINGGNDKTKYYTSLGYFEQEGWFRTNRFRRYSTKLNIEHRFNDKVKFGVNLIGNHSINNKVASHEGGLRLLVRSLEQRPVDNAFLPDGSYAIGGPDVRRHNGVEVIDNQDAKYNTYRGIFSAFAEYKPFTGFTYKPSLNVDYGTYHDNTYRGFSHPRGRGIKGQVLDSRNILTNVLIENLFSYAKSWGDLDLKVTAGHSYQKQSLETSLIDARTFPSPAFRAISSSAIQIASGFKTENALDSYLGRLSGTLKDRYFLDVAFRRDGSSKFADGKKYGNFPSASLGWVVSREPFFGESKTFNFLKLRASYGVTGSTSSIGDYSSLALSSGGANYLGASGLSSTQLPNPELTWEQSTSYNFGINIGLFEDRIKLTADYYTRDTDDLLYNKPVHSTTGFTSFAENIGSMTNKGFEFAINAGIIQTDDFSWDLGFNISTTENELTALVGDAPIPLSYNVLQVGESIGSLYLLKQTGIYQSDSEVPASLSALGIRAGDVIYEDVNNDGLITPEDRQVVGNPFPDFFGGVNTSVRYKNIDLSISTTFSSGNDIYAAWRSGGFINGSGGITTAAGFEGLGFADFGVSKVVAENRWTGSGTSNTTPRAIASGTAASHNNQASTRWLEDGSFFRVKNITLGYTLPQAVLDKLLIDKLRIYVTGSNLFTFTKYSGYDPEASESADPRTFGVDFLTAPPLRTVTLGLNLNF